MRNNAQLSFDEFDRKHGPYGSSTSPAHEGMQDDYTSSSELCGTCHQVTNPLSTWKNASGASMGHAFPLDTTYEEWKSSSYAAPGGKGCVSCHMEVESGDVRVAAGGPMRSNVRKHTLVGANLWGLQAVQAANPELAKYREAFAASERATQRVLSSAATVEISLSPTYAAPGDTVTATVRVINHSGHKLPTGYADGRRAFVELAVGGEVISGRYDAATAGLIADSQLRVYQAQHGVHGKGPGEHIALHDRIFSDTRIPPAGFRATDATRPVGTSWFDDGGGGYRNYDLATYTFTVPSHLSGTAVVTARLLYQSTTREYVSFLERENRTDDRGRTLASTYAATGKAAPVEMTRASTYLDLY
jgi:hypothetical protein